MELSQMSWRQYSGQNPLRTTTCTCTVLPKTVKPTRFVHFKSFLPFAGTISTRLHLSLLPPKDYTMKPVILLTL